MTGMHVTLVGSHPLPGEPGHGGVQRVVQVLRRGLAGKVRVSLVVPDASQHLRYADESGEIVYLKRPACPRIASYWSWCSRAAHREIKRLAPDVIHVQDLAGFALLWPRADAGSQQPWIFTPHGVNDREVMHKSKGDLMRELTASLRSAFIRSIEKKSRERFDASIIINPYLFDAMSDLSAKQYRIISNPVDEVFFTAPKRVASTNREHRLLYAGEVSALKNILALIHIVGALVDRREDARLDVVGPFVDPDYLRKCRAAVESMKLNGRVTFHGRVKPEDLVVWMDRSDILVLASKQETAPMVVAEAHCRGLPVAVPRGFGLVSMISEGVDGIFLDGPSAPDDAARISDFLGSGLDRNSIRRTAICKYELRSIVERTIEVYQDALGRRVEKKSPIVAHAGRHG